MSHIWEGGVGLYTPKISVRSPGQKKTSFWVGIYLGGGGDGGAIQDASKCTDKNRA